MKAVLPGWLLLLPVLMAAFSCHAMADGGDSIPSDGGARITFETKTVDLGVFKADEEQECVFVFRNDGDEPLALSQVFTDCGCTVPSYSRDPVLPGEQGTINIRFNGKGRRPGAFKKIVKVRSNAVNSLVRIYVIGRIKRE